MFEFSSSSPAFFLWLASLAVGDCWTYGSAFVVLMGVVGESIAELTKWVKPECRAKKLAKVSALVLILGLAGDLVAIHMTQISTASLNHEAGEARKKAGGADERSKNLESSNKQLAIDLETAKSDFSLKQSELAREQRKTAKAQKEAAEAQLALRRHIEEVARRQEPRRLSEEALSQRLKGKPKTTVDLWYAPNDIEAYWFASQIYRALKGAEWTVSEPKPIPANSGEKELNNPNAPPAAKFSGAGSRSGITVLSRELFILGKKPETPLTVLVDALGQAMSPSAMMITEEPALPSDLILLVVEPKQ